MMTVRYIGVNRKGFTVKAEGGTVRYVVEWGAPIEVDERHADLFADPQQWERVTAEAAPAPRAKREAKD